MPDDTSRLVLVRLAPGESLKSWNDAKDEMDYDDPDFLPVRQPVLLFTESMELKLRKHDDDRGPEGWVPDVVGDPAPVVAWRVWNALAKELNELGGAVSGELQTEEQFAHMMSEAADVANLAMMLWDIARRERAKLKP
jgi:hypothetical protein